jgi:hypothetical protein
MDEDKEDWEKRLKELEKLAMDAFDRSNLAYRIGSIVGVFFLGLVIFIAVRSFDNETKLSLAAHQIVELLEFKREVEETGSPILQAQIKALNETRIDIREMRVELKALSTDYLRSHKDKPPDF